MQDDHATQPESRQDVGALTARIADLERQLAAVHERCTEQEQQVQQLRAQLEQSVRSSSALRALLEIIPGWVFVKDQQHRYHMVSRSYADALHLDPKDFLGKNDLDLGFPEELVKGDPLFLLQHRLQKTNKLPTSGPWCRDRSELLRFGEIALGHLPGELVRLVPVSVFRRFADVPDAPALRWPLCDRTRRQW